MSSWRWVWAKVADADRPGVFVALQVREALLGQDLAPVDAVYDLERSVGLQLRAPVLHPAHENPRLVGVPEPVEAIERERRVPDPGVAIVPVPSASDPLRQAERGGGDDPPKLP